MPGGFFRGLAKAAVDSYIESKAQAHAQAQLETQTSAPNSGSSTPPNHSSGRWNNQQDPYGYSVQNDTSQPYNSSYTSNGHSMSQYSAQHLSGRPVYNSFEHGQAPPPPPPRPHERLQQESAIHFAKVESKAPTATVTEIEPPTAAPISTAGCIGPQNPLVQGYCTASVPDMDICLSCHQEYISTSCFASSFRKIQYPTGSRHCCDMSLTAVRDAWVNACARAGPNPSAHEQGIWLQQFAQQFMQIGSQIQTLGNELTSLIQEIQILQVQQQYQQKSALMQIKHGIASQSVSRMDLSSPVWTNAGSISQHVGHNRLVGAGQMGMDIGVKQLRARQLNAQLKDLSGVDFLQLMS